MPGPYRNLTDIPQFTRSGHYSVNTSWRFLESTLSEFAAGYGLDLDPDFQRGHVWTEAQQIRYVEFILRGGKTGRELLFNKPGWGRTDNTSPLVLVDGKQRLEAVRRFLRNEITAFGSFLSEYGDKLNVGAHNFTFTVNDLSSRAEVLQWYLDLNSGGTVHSDDEIARVRALLAAEQPAG